MRARGLAGAFWPSALQERLLALALAPDDQVAGLWKELQPIRIETLETGTYCLLPLVYQRLTAAGVEDAQLDRLRGALRSVWYRNQLQLDRLRAVVEALRRVESDPLVPDGLVLATRYYGDLGLRPVPQLDVVVRPAEGGAARQAIESAGWRRSGGRPTGFARFASSDGTAVLVLHEGMPPLFAGPLSPRAALEQVRERASVHDLGDAPVAVLEPADELLFACALGASTAVAQSPQWLLDVWHVFRFGVDGAEVASRAGAFRLVPAVRDTVRYLDRVAPTRALARVVALLEAISTSPRDELAHRLTGAGRGRFGGVPLVLATHARMTIADPLPRAIASLPSSLAAAWDVDARRLPLVAGAKAASRLQRAGRRPA